MGDWKACRYSDDRQGLNGLALRIEVGHFCTRNVEYKDRLLNVVASTAGSGVE